MKTTISLPRLASFLFFLCMNTAIVIGFSQFHEEQLLQYGLMFFAALFLLFKYVITNDISLKNILISLFFIGIAFASYFYTRRLTLFQIVLYVLAAKNLNLEDILKFNIASLVIATGFIFFTSLIGVTDKYYFDASKAALRLGFANPNTVAVIMFSILASYNLIRKSKPSFKTIGLDFLYIIFCYFVFKSRSELVAGIIYILILALVQNISGKGLFYKILFPFQYSFLAGTILIGYILEKYDSFSSTWNELNFLLSGRLFYWHAFLDYYGIKLFGNRIVDETMPLDNGYIFLLIYQGVILLLLMNYIYIYVSRYAYMTKNKTLLVTIFAYAFYCAAETAPLYFNLSPIGLIFAQLIMNRNNTIQKAR